MTVWYPPGTYVDQSRSVTTGAKYVRPLQKLPIGA